MQVDGDEKEVTDDKNDRIRMPAPPSEKTYYLFTGEKVTTLQKQDFSGVRKQLSRRLSEFQSPVLRSYRSLLAA